MRAIVLSTLLHPLQMQATVAKNHTLVGSLETFFILIFGVFSFILN